MFRIRNRSLFNLSLCLPVYMQRFSPHTSVASLLIFWLFLQTNSMERVLSFGYYPLLHLNVFSSFVPLVLEYICASCADRFPHRDEFYGRAFVWYVTVQFVARKNFFSPSLSGAVWPSDLWLSTFIPHSDRPRRPLPPSRWDVGNVCIFQVLRIRKPVTLWEGSVSTEMILARL